MIHFIGIGGIGVSALAKQYLAEGAAVSGSDLKRSEITDELSGLGARIKIGHRPGNLLKKTERVIYTAATPLSNPELREAKKRRCKVQTYAEAVGELTRRCRTITISGAHGKSTTTALTALALIEGYWDPTVIVGTKVREFGDSNFRRGYGPFLVLEADEWNRSFLHYSPEIAVFTNIDAEHLDTYGTVEGVETAFRDYMARVPRNGKIIVNRDDARLVRVAEPFRRQVVWYSLRDRAADTARRILRIPGAHNVLNALAAFTVGRALGVRDADILRALSRFSGTWRRFEFKGLLNGAFVFTDYGHHPTEIQKTLAAARARFPFRRLWCVYEPHQRERLMYLWSEFTGAFDLADRVCLLPVYDVAGRETRRGRKSANSEKLAEEIRRRGKNSQYLESFTAARELIRNEARQGDVIFVMGAGGVYTLTDLIQNDIIKTATV